jgi:hypothetical protein
MGSCCFPRSRNADFFTRKTYTPIKDSVHTCILISIMLNQINLIGCLIILIQTLYRVWERYMLFLLGTCNKASWAICKNICADNLEFSVYFLCPSSLILKVYEDLQKEYPHWNQPPYLSKRQWMNKLRLFMHSVLVKYKKFWVSDSRGNNVSEF